MTTYIALFTAEHRIIQVKQNSVFIWQQEGGEIDQALLSDKIARESSLPFFQIVAGKNYEVTPGDISVTVSKTEPFSG